MSFNLDNVKTLLNGKVDDKTRDGYLSCLLKTYSATKKGGQLTNKWWMDQKNDQYYVNQLMTVLSEGLTFDCKNVCLISIGISYNYIAYKNKMLNIYPESLFDMQIVRDGDGFSFSKHNGKVTYDHKIGNPFKETEVIGVYCIIKNQRGEFLTTLNAADIKKHRALAKQDAFWEKWFNEMVYKTVIKKAVKYHYNDIFETMEAVDNEQYELDDPVSLTISDETKTAVQSQMTLNDLTDYYKKHKDENQGVLESFTRACAEQKAIIIEQEKQKEEES